MDTGTGPSPANLTREELYDLVWQTPMMRLGEKFGISGNGLAKICRRLDVPYPPRGYWAKLAAGKKVRVTPLPSAKTDTPHLVRISPSVPKEAQQLQPEVQQVFTEVEEKASSVRVPERLHRPHPIVAAWLNNHEEQRRAARRERDPWFRDINMPKPFTDQDRRRHRILNALFKELEGQGYRVEEKDRKLFVLVSSEQIEIELREKLRQVRRPLTEEEKRWAYSNKTGTKQELQPTGFLVFSIKSYFRGSLRREWLENDGSPMEELLSQIVPTIVAAGHLVAELAREREEEAHLFAIRQQQAEEERRVRQLEQNRWRRLVEISRTWRDAEIVREFIAGLRAFGDDQQLVGDKPIGEWIEWAEKSLLAADPLIKGPARVFSDIADITPWSYRE